MNIFIITLPMKDLNKYYFTTLDVACASEDNGTRALKGICRDDNISLFSCRSNSVTDYP